MITIASSVRVQLVGIGLLAVGGMAAAQDMPAQYLPENGGAGIRTGNIAATGRTMPNPGVSKSGGTTPMDKGIERENDKIQSSICKGC